jgi:hypothetical protein
VIERTGNLRRYRFPDLQDQNMSLSTPKPHHKSKRSLNDMLLLPERQQDRRAVINNDWVPATHSSPMHHAQPVRLMGPLRPQWYVDTIKKWVTKSIHTVRSMA